MNTSTVLTTLFVFIVMGNTIHNIMGMAGLTKIVSQNRNISAVVLAASVMNMIGFAGLLLMLMTPSGSETIFNAVRCVFVWPAG